MNSWTSINIDTEINVDINVYECSVDYEGWAALLQ